MAIFSEGTVETKRNWLGKSEDQGHTFQTSGSHLCGFGSTRGLMESEREKRKGEAVSTAAAGSES
jgi:hypothetical protein